MYVQPVNPQHQQIYQQTPIVTVRDSLYVNQSLHRNERLTSRNGRFAAIVQDDSNFVVYDNGHAIWASNTVGHPGNLHLILQGDGNLVLYHPSNPGMNEHPIWDSKTYGRCHNPTLIMQDDGNLVLYTEAR